jgi:hypothetical protein
MLRLEDIMNALLLFAVSAGFGSLAWTMLAISDWLLSEKKDSQAARRLVERPALRPITGERSVQVRGLSASPKVRAAH